MRTFGSKQAIVVLAGLCLAQQANAQAGGDPTAVLNPKPLFHSGTGLQPLGDPQSWIKQTDYPIAALHARQTGDVAFRLDIDDSGLVSGCSIVKSSGSESLDKATCSIMRRRARFIPGRDADNEPVGGGYHGGVRWDLPAQTGQGA